MTLPPVLEKAFNYVQSSNDIGLGHNDIQDVFNDGKHVTIRGNKVVNFASCSYLGFDTDQRMREGAINAIRRFGNQFSVSRSYLSLPQYKQLETLLGEIFKKPVIVGPTTTLSHISLLPTLIHKNAAVILDHQVHASVQSAAKLLKASGIHVEILRHSRLDYLENRIKKLSGKFNKIWYMVDGIYSMFGDTAPLPELENILNSYEQFHLYVDDAHGMGWAGENGAGFTLSKMAFHPKMILVTSLNKSFSAGGAAMVFPNEKCKQLVNNCGSTLMFSGPLQPANLGAGIEAAKIHLSEEIYEKQRKLQDRITFFNKVAIELGLPLADISNTPIFFIGLGKPEVGQQIGARLLKSGFYASLGIFPSVPENKTGLRITLTLHHSFEDISELLHNISKQLKRSYQLGIINKDELFKTFNLPEKMSIPIQNK